MRTVYVVSGGVSKFAKARPDKTFQAIVKEAYDYAIADLGLELASSSSWSTARWPPTSPTTSPASSWPASWSRTTWDCAPSRPPRRGRRRHRRHLLPGGLEVGRLGRHGRLPGLRLRDDEPRQDLEGQRVHRPGLRRQLRLPGRRLLLRLLRHDGHPAHEGVRHHRRADGPRVGEEPPERLYNPYAQKHERSPSPTCAPRRWSPGR